MSGRRAALPCEKTSERKTRMNPGSIGPLAEQADKDRRERLARGMSGKPELLKWLLRLLRFCARTAVEAGADSYDTFGYDVTQEEAQAKGMTR
jgi:hypothetical protein